VKRRYLSLWFKYLTTDWQVIRRPELLEIPFVFAVSERGRKVITSMNSLAEIEGLSIGMNVADARAIYPELEVLETKKDHNAKLLNGLGSWCIRYAPSVAIDLPEGLLLDISGCAHLWGGESAYLKEIVSRLKSKGYYARAAIADTIGAAWAIARFGKEKPIIGCGEVAQALLTLPPAALRLEPAIVERLNKLGLTQIQNFISMPTSALRRRFGEGLIRRIAQALGNETEYMEPIVVPEPYQERLPCLEPIRTAIGIEIAIKKLLDLLCARLQQEGLGIRTLALKSYRIDGKIEQVSIGTNTVTNDVGHLFKLFELKISEIRPALGIELFVLEANQIENVPFHQERLWDGSAGFEGKELRELLDRLAMKVGTTAIRRYLPAEHYWPERSMKLALSLVEKPSVEWRTDRLRPTILLNKPALIEVSAPVPDYPPMSFKYQDKLHYVKKADGPERIEREWWLDAGEHRDYYQVEDEHGQRYWIFRLGHYGENTSYQWFLHGFFA
jgi:protein ImuB